MYKPWEMSSESGICQNMYEIGVFQINFQGPDFHKKSQCNESKRKIKQNCHFSIFKKVQIYQFYFKFLYINASLSFLDNA